MTETIPSSGQVTMKQFQVKLDYGVPVQAKNQELSCVISYLTAENFPETITGKFEADAMLINFGEFVESTDALVRLEQMGLRAGTPSELADLHLSNPAPNPELEGCFPITALGTVWTDPDEDRAVAYLRGGAFHRELYLRLFDRGWRRRWWFLAFRKSASQPET